MQVFSYTDSNVQQNSGLIGDDLAILAKVFSKFDSIIFTKVDTLSVLSKISSIIHDAGGGMRAMLTIESPQGLVNLGEVCRAAYNVNGLIVSIDA